MEALAAAIVAFQIEIVDFKIHMHGFALLLFSFLHHKLEDDKVIYSIESQRPQTHLNSKHSPYESFGTNVGGQECKKYDKDQRYSAQRCQGDLRETQTQLHDVRVPINDACLQIDESFGTNVEGQE